VSGTDSTIGAIQLDDAVQEENDEVDDEESGEADAKALAAANYAKARIPKPVLAEANYVMKALSDDDRAYMRKALLVGLERGGSMGRTPNELARLAEGKGHRFAVHQVASAGMKDGSVTLPLGSVNVQPGTRMRFFVRESDYAKREVEALWMAYKKRALSQSFEADTPAKTFNPSTCFLFPTLDRGNKFFGGKPGYESASITQFLPSLPCISGFFSNGVLGRLDDFDTGSFDVSVHGSASAYVLIGSSK
jgi:small ligand-binding sensory domain FIST